MSLMAERYDTESNVNFGGFQTLLQASYVSIYADGLRYNIYIYIYIEIYREREGDIAGEKTAMKLSIYRYRGRKIPRG